MIKNSFAVCKKWKYKVVGKIGNELEVITGHNLSVKILVY